METPTNAFAGMGKTEIVKTPESEKVIQAETLKPVTLDGQPLPAGMTVKISLKQWRALSRHFKWVSGPKKHAPAPPPKEDDEEKTDSGIGKAAALIAVIFALFFGAVPAKAAPPSTFGDLPIPTQFGFLPTNGNTFGLTNTGCGATTTNTWVAQNNAAGLPTNVLGVTKFDTIFLTLTGAAQTGTSGFTNTFTLWQGNGKGVWDTNHPLAILPLGVPSGVNAVLETNLAIGADGYIVVGTVGNITGATPGTNLAIEVQVKPIRSGN